MATTEERGMGTDADNSDGGLITVLALRISAITVTGIRVSAETVSAGTRSEIAVSKKSLSMET